MTPIRFLSKQCKFLRMYGYIRHNWEEETQMTFKLNIHDYNRICILYEYIYISMMKGTAILKMIFVQHEIKTKTDRNMGNLGGTRTISIKWNICQQHICRLKWKVGNLFLCVAVTGCLRFVFFFFIISFLNLKIHPWDDDDDDDGAIVSCIISELESRTQFKSNNIIHLSIILQFSLLCTHYTLYTYNWVKPNCAPYFLPFFAFAFLHANSILRAQRIKASTQKGASGF